jgi:hypothetical protein
VLHSASPSSARRLAATLGRNKQFIEERSRNVIGCFIFRPRSDFGIVDTFSRPCSAPCGKPHRCSQSRLFTKMSRFAKILTHEPPAGQTTSLRAASRAHEVLCTPNSSVGFAHVAATREKNEGCAIAQPKENLTKFQRIASIYYHVTYAAPFVC